MEGEEKPANWIPISFTSGQETGEGDSFSSFQSEITPETTAVDQPSNEPSFDVSLPNIVVTNEESSEKVPVSLVTTTSENKDINVFEEDARSSWSEEPKQTELKETVADESSQNCKQTELKETIADESSQNCKQTELKETIADESSQNCKQTDLKETVIDESSQASVTSQKSSEKKEGSDDEEVKREFPPENLFEYMWPVENGEFFILQEQICDYLNVKSFKRKYPELTRRCVDVGERKFLKDKGVVTEMQCDLGLTALKSEEVLELMSKDYPDHYKEYIKVLRDKQQRSLTEKHKEFAANNSDKNRMKDLLKKAVTSAAEYNAHLNQERREERRSCMDLQTYTIHYPVKPNKVKHSTKPGKYPVALLPGQFQDYYKEYSSEELKYLPVNTVLYGPLKELKTIKTLSDGSHSDSEDSTASEGSCCSSSQGTHDESSSGSEKTENSKKVTSSETPYRPKVKTNALCKVCKLGPEGKLKDGKPEELVHCSACDNSAHASCIGLSSAVVDVLKTYPWQCTDCKICSHCRDPGDEEKMLFCDICDRGYHTFCVGLKSLPQGKWICRQCGSCSICGINRPGPESSRAQWLYDTKTSVDSNSRHPRIFCQSCFKKKK